MPPIPASPPLGPDGSGTAVQLVAALLRYCLREHGNLQTWASQNNWNLTGGPGFITRVDDVIGRLVASPAFRPALAGAVFDWSAPRDLLASAGVPGVVAARILVDRFVEHFGERVLACLYLRSPDYPPGGRRPVAPGDLIYTPLPAVEWFRNAGFRPGPLPHSVPTFPLPSPLRSFSIAESDLFGAIDVWYDLTARRLVDELFRDLKGMVAAACVPNRELAAEYDLDRVDTWIRDGQGYFFGVRAADLDRQRVLFELATARAVAGGANVSPRPHVVLVQPAPALGQPEALLDGTAMMPSKGESGLGFYRGCAGSVVPGSGRSAASRSLFPQLGRTPGSCPSRRSSSASAQTTWCPSASARFVTHPRRTHPRTVSRLTADTRGKRP